MRVFDSIFHRLITATLIAVFAIQWTPVKPVHALACAASATGNWNSLATWSCGAIPGIGDTVTIGTPFTVTLTGNESAMSVIINNGGTLVLNTFTLTLSSASTGMTVNTGGILNAGTGIVADDGAGGAQFTLANNATLQTANTLGITTGVALTGSIQVRGLRTYTTGANYVYNGTADQSVGNGLTQNTPRNLTINNPGNIVSLAAPTTISGSLILTAGTLNLAANAATVGDIQGAANVTSNTAGAVTLTTGSNNANTTYSGVISNGSGTVALTKLGTGALTLSGASTYSGGTILSAGTININNASAIGTDTFTISGGTINNTSGAAITLSNNNPMNWNGNFTFTGTNALNLGTGAVTLSANRTVTANASTLTVGGVIGGAFRLTKAGNGTLTLNAANTHSGITLTAGRINIGNAQALGNVASIINLNGGTFDNTTGAALTLPNYAYSIGGNVTFAGTNNLNMGTNTVTLTGNRTLTVTANTLTIDGVIGGAFRLTKAGNGNLTLNGINTHSGTTLTAGRINIGNVQALGNVASVINLNGGTIDNTTGAALTLPNYAYSIGGNVTFAGTNNLNMGTNTVTLTGNRTLTVTANTLTIDGVIGGAFRLTKAGNGNLTLNGVNTHSGTTLTAGRINIGNAQAFGNAASTINLNGGTIDNTSGAALTLPNNPYSIGGNVTFAGTNSLNLGSGAVTLTGNRTITTTANTLTIGGNIGGVFRLTKAGNGNLTLNGANTHSGTTLTTGRLNIGNAQALGNVASTFIINGGSIDNTSGAALTTLNYPQTWGASFTFVGTNNLNLGTGAVAMTGNRTVTITANTLTVNGVISGAARRLTKAGAGTLTLGGANIHTGGVTLTAGTLNINNSQALGTIAGTFIINGGIIDNTSAAAITTLNYPQTWGGNFTFTGTNNLNLGTGAVTLSANRTVTVTANTLTVGGTVSPNTVDLTKTGAGTLSFGSNAVNLRNLTISAGTLISTSGSMNLAGNFTNNATFTHNNGTVNFNGAVAQSISGVTTFNNLTLNNANGLTINAAETINGILTLSNGRINTGANILIIETSGSISGAVSGRHVNGFLQKNFPVGAGQSFSFPVGNAATYAPVDIANLDVATSGGIIASTTAAEHPNIATSGIDAARDVNRYWTLSPAGAISLSTYDAIFNFVVGDVDGGANTSNFVVKRYSGGWTTPTTGTRTATSTQATGITVLGSFADGELSNFPPTDISLSATAIDENQPSASAVGTLGTTDPDIGDTFTYSLVNGGVACPGTDNASFSISGDTLQTAAMFDYETQNSYAICVRTTDSVNNTFDKQFTITVNNINEDPTDITLSNNTIDENQAANTVVGTLSAIDPDAGATFTFSLGCTVPGADDASFNILGTDLRSSSSFDFETQNTFNICVRATDQGGLFYDENFVVNVNDLNEAPTNISLSNFTIDENEPAGTSVGTLSANDPDAGATFTFSLGCAVPGADDASFSISGTDLQSSASFDYESKNFYDICIRVTDQNSLTYDENFSILVNDINEAPTDINLSSASIDENLPAASSIGTLSSTDPDAGDTFTYSLVNGGVTCPGTDNASFSISGTALESAVMFDYETQNSYVICVQTTDSGSLTYDEPFTINITNINEGPTDIALSANTIDENQPSGTLVGTLTSTDVDDSVFTYSLVNTLACPGADNSQFQIGGSGDELQSAASFDYETQASFTICIRSTDSGSNTFDEQFTINVNNINEAPTDIALSGNSIDENQIIGTFIGTLTSTDADDSSFTYSLVNGGGACPGTDNALFQIGGGSNDELQSAAVFDYETATSYAICVRTTDSASNTFDEPFTINIGNINEPPTDMTLSNNMIDENQPAGTTVGTLTTVDVDDTVFTYSFVDTLACPGPDNASFQVGGGSNDELQNAAVFDYETTSSYTVCIRTTDSGSNSYDEQFTITVTDRDEILPTVTVEQASGQADPTDVSPIHFTITFSEPINTGTFVPSDISFSGTATPSVVVISQIAQNDDTTFDIAASGVSGNGSVIASIAASMVDDLNGNGNAASTSTDNSVTYDTTAPSVASNGVNTVNDTGDGILTDYEVVTVNVTQLIVEFTEDVFDPAGDTDPDDVTNPDNYILVREFGDTSDFQTLDCASGPVEPEDTRINVSGVTYDNINRQATFTVNGGLPLSNGSYRLFVCGTTSIVDLTGIELNFNGTTGVDHLQTFIVNISNGGNGNGGGGNPSSTGSSGSNLGLLIPVTGFAPGEITPLPAQPLNQAYTKTSIQLEIPDLNVNADIVGIKKSGTTWDVKWLGSNVGYLEGSAYPTWSGNTVLTGHLTDAKNVPGPFARLKELEAGDKVYIHMNGMVYVYQIEQSMLVSPTNVSAVFKHQEYNWLTLVTCENYNEKARTYTSRRLVRAILISVIEDR